MLEISCARYACRAGVDVQHYSFLACAGAFADYVEEGFRISHKVHRHRDVQGLFELGAYGVSFIKQVGECDYFGRKN